MNVKNFKKGDFIYIKCDLFNTVDRYRIREDCEGKLFISDKNRTEYLETIHETVFSDSYYRKLRLKKLLNEI